VTFAGNVLVFLATLAGGMITARVLGPGGRGSFALLHTTPDLIISFVLLGIVQTNVCFISNGILPARRMIRVSLQAALVQSIAGLGVFAVLALFFREQFLGGSGPVLVALSAALVPLGILQAHWSSLLSGLRRFGRLAFIRAIAPLLLVAGYMLLLVGLGLGVGGGLAAVLASTALILAMMLSSLRAGARSSERVCGDGDRGGAGGFWRRYLSYGIKLHASALIWYLMIRIDIYMIKSMLDIESVGFFALASGLAEKLWLISTSANTVLLPSLAAIPDPVERARMAARASRQLTIVLLPFFVLGILLGRPLIVLLYGAEFEPSALPFMILLGSTLVQAHRSMTASFFESSDLALVNVATRIAAFLLKVVLNLVLIPVLLLQGAALASLAAYSVEWVLGTGVFLRRSGLPWSEAIPSGGDLKIVRSKLRDLARMLIPGAGTRTPGGDEPGGGGCG
jgi:O-antigen/teichoic acid export membrane protein